MQTAHVFDKFSIQNLTSMTQIAEPWPPNELIEGLELEQPEIETELDENVLKGRGGPCSSYTYAHLGSQSCQKVHKSTRLSLQGPVPGYRPYVST